MQGEEAGHVKEGRIHGEKGEEQDNRRKQVWSSLPVQRKRGNLGLQKTHALSYWEGQLGGLEKEVPAKEGAQDAQKKRKDGVSGGGSQLFQGKGERQAMKAGK